MGNLCSCCKGESENFKSAVKILKRERYKYERKLGMGAFGEVIQVRTLDKKRLKFAAKFVSSEKCSHVELALWRSFQHDNVIPLLEIIQESDINIFLMPLHKLTMIEAIKTDRFIKSAESFNETKNWITGVLRGLEYLHGINVCHADLKVNNILITNRRTAVICDFSFSCLKTGNIIRSGLPSFFRPPEALFHDGSLDPVNGENFDLWSFGIVALYTWTRIYSDEWISTLEHWQKLAYPLLFDCLQLPMFNILVKGYFPNAVITPEEISQALNLLQGILQYEAKKRPRASIILQHAFLNKEARRENLLDVSSIWTYRHSNLPNDLENFSSDFDIFTIDSPEKRTNEPEENTFSLSSPRKMVSTGSESHFDKSLNVDITKNETTNRENMVIKIPAKMEPIKDQFKESLSSKDMQDYQLSTAEDSNKNLSSKRSVTFTSDFCHSHLQHLGYSLLHELFMSL